jgi:hypothetical protein
MLPQGHERQVIRSSNVKYLDATPFDTLDGQYWVPDVALGAGTNTVTMISTGPAGAASTNSLTLIKSGEQIGITVESNAFTSFNSDRSARVGVTSTNDDLTITVNGQSASMVQQVGNVFYWIADDVPGTEDGWMELTAVAVPTGGGAPITALYEWEKPPLLRMKEYHLDTGYTGNELASYYQEHTQLDYVRKSGGSYQKDYYNGCTETWGWNADDSPTPYVMTCTNGFAYTNMAGNGSPPNELDELTDVTLTEEGVNYFWTFHRVMDQQIELRAGGKPYAGRVDLVRLHVFEPEEIGYDFPGDAPPPFSAFEAGTIDPTTISVMGSAADTNGYVFAQVAPSSVQNPTPVVPKASQEMDLAVSQAKLQIIRDGTTDITWKTNRVIVGERIALECKLDNTNVATITSFNWEVPGNVVSGFTNTTHYGEGLALTNKTNSGVTFYWVEGNKVLVSCNVIANGKLIPAKSTFLVLPAIGTLQADFITNVAINGGTNVSLGGNPLPGIRFLGAGYAPYGLISQGKWEFCQVVRSTDVKVNLSTNAGENPASLVRNFTNALDKSYPYPTVQTQGNVFATLDNPREPTVGSVKLWRDDVFTMFFMFQPTNVAGSIPVPVRKIDWSWGAIVTSATNLASGYANIVEQNQIATTHPSWRTNSFPIPPWQTNAFHYPP